MKKTTIAVTVDQDIPLLIRTIGIQNISKTVNDFLRAMISSNSQISDDKLELINHQEEIQNNITKINEEHIRQIETLSIELSQINAAIDKVTKKDDKETQKQLNEAIALDRSLKASNFMLKTMEEM